ncbi:MAG: UDP-glucose/GDP-mannose dehydrogenase family protein [Terriglobales bacterium]
MKLSIVGAGYVGLTTAACLAEIGHQVYCSDSDQAKLGLLQQGQIPFFEPHLAQLVARNCQSGRLEFGATETGIERSEAIFICVGTPPLSNGEADLSAIQTVAREIAARARGYRLIVEKSTVPVQTARQIKRELALYGSQQLDYEVASNPEFLREGSALEDFFHPDRIVVGVESRRAEDQFREVYRPVLEQTFACPVHENCISRTRPAFLVTDTNSSEIIKHASNSFLAMKISYINMVADLCEASGADVEKVAEGIGLDRRIGRAFLRPGIGFGGFCFPKDLQAFVRIAEKAGCDFSLLKEVEKVNLARIAKFVDKVRQEVWVLRGKKLALWGLAFKPNTDDIRFAPSLAVIQQLLAEGADLQVYDPEAMPNARRQIAGVKFSEDPYEAARGAEAVLILTEWDQFRTLDWERLGSLLHRRLIIDGRNMLAPVKEQLAAQGFEYVEIGRVAHAAEPAAQSASRAAKKPGASDPVPIG